MSPVDLDSPAPVQTGLIVGENGRRDPGDHSGRGPLTLALVLASVFHGGLLFAGSWRQTYDAWVHIFFADHYQRSWFDLFEPRWYTGFSVASYPPAAHQAVAGVGWAVGLEAAFILVQLASILLLVAGVYRFAAMWVGPRSAGFAAVGVALSTALAQTVHVFGQLPTVLAMALLLHAAAPVVSWLRSGDIRALGQSLLLVGAAAAVHHVTIIFGAAFVLGALGLMVLIESVRSGDRKPLVVVGRGALLAVVSFLIIGLVLLPYWIWSTTDPIRQVPIPHGSRDDFLEVVPSAWMFFLVPWGGALLAWLYVIARGARSGLWPLALSSGFLTLLGLGGTTPVARAALGSAFDILALDRFTFWAVMVASPLLGDLFRRIWDHGLGRGRVGTRGTKALRSAVVAVLVIPAFVVVNLPQLWRLQPDELDPQPAVEFLAKDRHWQWRYITLGFGDQLAGLGAATPAANVEGNYHSARRLPVLTSTPIERLDGAKFSGQAGMDSLRQVLSDPDDFGLKFVFSNDDFYDPVLHFTGWSRVAALRNGVHVWERAGVPLPTPPTPAERSWQDLWWGLVPPLALLSGLAALGTARWRARHVRRSTLADTLLLRMLTDSDRREPAAEDGPAASTTDRVDRPHFWWLALSGSAGLALLAALTGPAFVDLFDRGPERLAERYVAAVVEGRFEDAHALVEPGLEFEEYLSDRSIELGLNRSYARIGELDSEMGSGVVAVTARVVDPFGERTAVFEVPVVDAGDRWLVRRPERVAMPLPADLGSQAVESNPWVLLPEDPDVTDRLRPEAQAPTIQLLSAQAVERDGLVHVIGALVNGAGVPADVTVSAIVRDRLGTPVAEHAVGDAMTHQLLPGEATPFRLTFEGVAGRVGEVDLAEFEIGRIDLVVRSVVTDRNLRRPVVVEGVAGSPDGVGGLLTNSGRVPIVVPSLLVAWMDGDLPVWVDRVYLDGGLPPAGRIAFELSEPDRPRDLDIPVVRSGATPELEIQAGGDLAVVNVGGRHVVLIGSGWEQPS